MKLSAGLMNGRQHARQNTKEKSRQLSYVFISQKTRFLSVTMAPEISTRSMFNQQRRFCKCLRDILTHTQYINSMAGKF